MTWSSTIYRDHAHLMAQLAMDYENMTTTYAKPDLKEEAALHRHRASKCQEVADLITLAGEGTHLSILDPRDQEIWKKSLRCLD